MTKTYAILSIMQEFPEILSTKDILYNKQFNELDHPLSVAVKRLLYGSDYACRNICLLKSLLNEDTCQQRLRFDDYSELLESINFDLPPHSYSSLLRQFRHRQLLRLMLRELLNLSDTYETMLAWSDCADAIIKHTLNYCLKQLSQRYGKPLDESGEASSLYVIAMGKLGGRELNFSSDIDLIFAFSEVGQTDGDESITNQQFYSKTVQQFLHLLQNVTSEGFVFRVDLRLRPNGESGPLVSSLAAMETYYQEQGRDWERFAMVKARLINIDGKTNDWFNRLITPFVYHRYIDFSVIESLRTMKTMIEREISLNSMLDDIKRGKGGIREIEFIIQCFQLIRGGRLPQIQQQNAMIALSALRQQGLLARTLTLQQAYLFMRKLENALQSLNDQQTHSLPTDPMKQAQIKLLMGFASWEQLLDKLQQYQRIVSNTFQATLGKVDSYENEKSLLVMQLTSIWQGHVESTMAVNLLASLGFNKPEHCYQMLNAFRHAHRCRRLSQAARMRLDRLMVLLLVEMTLIKDSDTVLLHFLSLLENIVGRSAYLALLTENPHVLKELLHWFAHSPFITSLLVSQPFLLEILIEQNTIWKPASRKQLEKTLRLQLSHCNDHEAQDEILRQFKLTCWLFAARAELYSQCHAVRIGRYLADVAEVIINEVVSLACLQLSRKYPDILRIKSRFAIIAYGKLGSKEMNYDSDVDLVFLHNVRPSEENLVSRLTQKILHMLMMRVQSGVLYLVDTRLRPSGSAGLLVSQIDAFIDYQCKNAWTWEHQALLRSRVLFGNKRIIGLINQMKKDVLFLPRNNSDLKDEVLNMRIKISKHLKSDAIKHVSGGLLDLEFLVQFLILANPGLNLIRSTNTLIQLNQLYVNNKLTSLQFFKLKRAYCYYHQLLHKHLLQPFSFSIDKEQAEVLAISQALYS